MEKLWRDNDRRERQLLNLLSSHFVDSLLARSGDMRPYTEEQGPIVPKKRIKELKKSP